MSATDRVKTVMQSDWNNLVNSVRNAKNEAASSRQAMRKAQQERSQEIDRINRRMKERERVYEATVSNMQSSLKDTVRQHKQDMKQQRDAFQRSMKKQAEAFDQKLDQQWDRTVGALEDIQDWTREEMDRQEEEFRNLMDQQQQQINSVRSDVDQILEKEAANVGTATAIVQDVERLIQETAKTFPEHEKFAPGRLENLQRRLDSAKGDINMNPGGAISLAKERLFDVLDLQQELEQKEWEFNDWFGRAQNAYSSLFENIRNNRSYTLGEDDDAAQLEVDYWTLGEMSALEEKVEEALSHLRANRSAISLEELKSLLKDSHPGLAKELESLIATAVGRAVASQVRAEMADSIKESFASQGYRIVASGYEQDDQRKGYLVKVRNVAGTELVVMISPNASLEENTIDLSVERGSIPPELRAELDQKIREDLRAAGVNMGALECSDDHIEGIYDVESIVKAGSKGIPEQALRRANLLNTEMKNVRNASQHGN